MEILKEIQQQNNSESDIKPNNRTWKELLRTAGKAKRSDILLQIWKTIVEDYDGGNEIESIDNSSNKARKAVSSNTNKIKR
jgi:hypothetical protein